MSSYTRDKKQELDQEIDDIKREYDDPEDRLWRFQELFSKWSDIHDELLGEAGTADEAKDELRALVAETENAIADADDT